MQYVHEYVLTSTMCSCVKHLFSAGVPLLFLINHRLVTFPSGLVHCLGIVLCVGGIVQEEEEDKGSFMSACLDRVPTDVHRDPVPLYTLALLLRDTNIHHLWMQVDIHQRRRLSITERSRPRLRGFWKVCVCVCVWCVCDIDLSSEYLIGTMRACFHHRLS